MATQYFCLNKRRRQEVLDHPDLNGIDYLEVLDRDALSSPPIDTPRQRSLLVRFLKPLAATDLGGANIRIDGGVRITPVGVVWAGVAGDAASLFTAGLVTASERDYLLARPDPDQLLVVRTDASGDYATYRLRLVTSPTRDAPPPGFDPMLSALEFSFKVECPSEFDCRVDDACPVEAPREPAIDYLAKDYASFRRLILDRLSVIMPDWRERSAADVGIAVVEVLAYAGDYLSYYQDAAATEAYLGTARQRASLRRHARLLDYPMHDGCNARAWVAFEVDAGGDAALLPRVDALSGEPTRLLSRLPAPSVVAPHAMRRLLGEHGGTVFELMHDLRLYQSHNRIGFHTWGDESCCLPSGATRATLRDDATNRLRLRPGDVLILVEQRDPGTGLAEDADPARRHAVRLTKVAPEALLDEAGRRNPGTLLTDPLFDRPGVEPRPIVEIEWHEQDALPFPLCLSTVIDGELISDVGIALGNVALADHGFSQTQDEALPAPAGHLRFRPRLKHAGITHQVIHDNEQALQQPASEMLVQDPRRALAAVELSGDGNRWRATSDLLASDRFAPEFVVEMENDGRARLRFGDGRVYGRRPPSARLTPRYRIGNGRAGNLGLGAIRHVVTPLGGITSVENPLPARGGVDPEPLEAVRQYAPQAFRTQERAVTEADYAAMAERHPRVQRAVATRRWTGSWHTLFVTVDRRGGLPVDAAFEAELRAFLERFRLAGHDLEIDAPRFVSLEIVLDVCVEPGYFRDQVKAALLETFGRHVLPDGRRGFFHPDNFSFAQPVYLSRVVATAMAVAGVQWVDVARAPDGQRLFRRWGENAHGETDAGRIAMDRLEIARLDNDPSQPEHGRMDFVMRGGA